MSLNINRRFYDKEKSFLAFLEDEDIDIAFVQEVGIDHFDLRRFYVNGYDTFVGTGNPTRVMTLVKRGSFKKVTQSDRTGGRREIWLTGTRFDGTQVKLTNVYSEWLKNEGGIAEKNCRHMELATDLSGVTGEHYLVGDLNLDFVQSRPYSHYKIAREVEKEVLKAGYRIQGVGNTFMRIVNGEVRTSALDYILHNTDRDVNAMKVDCGFSDHDAVKWLIPDGGATEMRKKKFVRRRDLKGLDKIALQATLAGMAWEDIAVHDLDEAANKFGNFIRDAFDKHAPEKVVEVKPRRSVKPSQTLRDLRNSRDMARRGGHKERFRILRNKCSSMCRKESMLEACKKLEDPNFVWQCHSSLTGEKGVRVHQIAR
jgi:hypothetical protein